MKRVVLAVLLGSLLIVGSAAHATSSHGQRSGGSSPTLDVTFAAAAATADGGSAATPYTVWGCGYGTAGVTIVVHSPVSIQFAGQMPNADGCISLSNFYTLGAGHYTVDAIQVVHKQDKVVASKSFDWS
jgi:hypothetical protein